MISISIEQIGAVAVAVLMLTVIVSGSVGAVSTGGPDVSSGSSDQSEDDESDDEDDSDQGDSTVVAQVDDRLRVTNYSYDDDEEVFSVELSNRGSTSSSVTITEAIDASDGGGSGSFGIEQMTVYGGETTTAEIDVGPRDPGVMITTEDSISAGRGTYLSADDGISLVDGAASWRDVQIGGVAGILSTMLMTIVVAWHVVARQSVDYEEADLSA